MAPEASSNIRVFIRWHDQTVFAGEEVKCTITFKNVASGPNLPKQQPSSVGLPSPLRRKSNNGLTPPSASAPSGRGHHRSALSLSVPSSRTHSRSGSLQWPAPSSATSDRHPPPSAGHAHKRSLSIVSIGSTSTIDDHPQRNEPPVRASRPTRGHGRASSLQIIPRAQNQAPPGPQSASISPRLSSSPLFHSSYPPPDRFGRMSRPPTAPNTPRNPHRSPRASPNLMPEFRFPAASPTRVTSPQVKAPNERMLSPLSGSTDTKNVAIRPKDSVPTINEQPAPAARILATSGILGGTPRSSGEFMP